jgi:hypothetical protein
VGPCYQRCAGITATSRAPVLIVSVMIERAQLIEAHDRGTTLEECVAIAPPWT